MPVSRRHFLQTVGAFAGTGAVYDAMVALGMVQTPSAWAGPLKASANVGRGKTVAILGAGMAGMMAALDLQRAGFRCVILEALDRAGGRNFTARRGTVVREDADPRGQSASTQVCRFDAGLYMNLGPARLPFHHPRVMDFCRRFQIPLEPYVMSSSADLFQADKAFGGQAMPRYRIDAGIQVSVAELLTKAVNQSALEGTFSTDEQAAFLDMLATMGGLPRAGGETVGSETPRAQCSVPTTVQAICAANPRLPLSELLKSRFWQNIYFQPSEGEWQATLFQPLGGMDKMVDALVKRLGKTIRLNAEVVDINNGPDAVSIAWRDRKRGRVETLNADYCLSNMPLPKLAKIKHNLSDEFRKAVEYARIGALYKLAWQANRRFWEEPPYNIYGGISYTDRPITQMWYPSTGYLSSRGIIAGSYAYFAQAEAFGRMTLSERIAAGRSDAMTLHKEFADETLVPSSKAVSIAWNLAEGQSGGVAQWDHGKVEDQRAYQRLLAPDGRFHVIGDQVSPLPGWQEGAFLSADHAVAQIIGQRPRDRAEMRRIPETARMLRGEA
jgi:monoamine oxidase